jgi:hypothetical protein
VEVLFYPTLADYRNTFFAGFARLSLWQGKHADEDEHAALAE